MKCNRSFIVAIGVFAFLFFWMAPPYSSTVLAAQSVTTPTPLPRVVGGLGVARDTIQRALENEGLIFAASNPTKDGVPVFIGTAKSIGIVLYGQPELLVQAGVVLDLGTAVDQETATSQMNLLFKFFDWLTDGDSSVQAWFALNMTSASPTPTVKEFGRLRVSIGTSEKRDSLVVSIEPLEAVSIAAKASSTPDIAPTPNAAQVVLADKQSYVIIDPRDLEKSPDMFRGQKVVISGEVFNIKEDKNGTTMQIWVARPGGSAFDRIAVYVTYPGSLPGLYKNDSVFVYGLCGGTVTGFNALGGVIGQPLIEAKYVDYGTAIPTPPAIAKNIATTLEGAWQLTYVGEFRDKTVFYPVGAKTAMGIWASIQFRIRNLLPGTARFTKDYDFVLIDENGKTYDDDPMATLYARWQYCGCDDAYRELAPGEEAVILVTFDVPESTRNLTVAIKKFLATKPLASPRFQVVGFDQVPAWKPKK